jgi:[NiFe] hydrogenase diaphorase moiety small subunit
MLFHEGNHLCPICEASGNCELQAMAYRLGMTEPTRSLSRALPGGRRLASRYRARHQSLHQSCGRCIRASQDVDGKGIFGYVGRGIHRRVAVNGPDLAHTDAEVTDDAPSRRSARSAASSASASASHADRRARIRRWTDRQ